MAATAMTAKQVFERHFLEVRGKLLEIAAVLDRVERTDDADALEADPRRAKLRQALALLAEPGVDRAEKLQLLFSRPYDPAWLRDLDRPRGSNGAK